MGGVRRRFWLRKSWRRGRRGEGHVFLFLAAAAGIGLALFVIGRIEAEVRPLAELLAEANVKNAVTALVNQAVEETLAAEAVAYDDLVTLDKRPAPAPQSRFPPRTPAPPPRPLWCRRAGGA